MTDDAPLISVLTRTYDRRELFKGAAASVLAQTWPNVEYVVVNDGGESVGDLLEPHQERMKVVYLEPGRLGRCAAGNVGLAAATGEYIAYLDDDDAFEPGHLEVLVRALMASPLKVAYSDAWCVEMTRPESSGPWVEKSRNILYSEEFSKIKLLQKAYIHIVTFMHHREVYDRLGGFDESLEVLEDWDMFFRYAQDYDFLHVKEPTARFEIRDDESNAINRYRKEFVETRSRLFMKYSHMAVSELVGQVEAGMLEVQSLANRIKELEAQVRHLKGGGP